LNNTKGNWRSKANNSVVMLRKCLMVAGLLLTGYSGAIAQSGEGLENIIVEKYYISDAKDTVKSDSCGYLPIGSVTYRIYADLKPVYRLQAVYGVPEHELRIETSTRFYNSKIGDGRSANDIQPANLKYGTLLLDSWVTVGAASLDFQAIMKSDDDTAKTFVWENIHGVLRNNDLAMGIPLTERDGMKYLRYQPATNYFNLDNDLRIFEYQYKDSVSGLFSTRDGAWASFGGTVGPQPENKVLIAQVTTDGVLKFELNMQLAVPDGGSIKFVARNPGKDEFQLSSLIYNSSPDNKAPVVTLNEQSKKKLMVGQKLEFTAVASDSDGSISGVDFYVNDRFVTSVTQAPYTFSYAYTGKPVKVSATAIDTKGAKGRSNDVFIPELKMEN
jgi:hypothetical protein